MKICTICNRTYTDETLNFCLDDGGSLRNLSDDAPPTIIMDAPRTTDQTNWQDFGAAPWQNQSNIQQQQPIYPAVTKSLDQTLPIISLVLGVLGVLLSLCCYAGLPLGAAAVITGFMGMNNTNKDPMSYGGRGMAIGGMAAGVIGFLISAGMFIIVLILGRQ